MVSPKRCAAAALLLLACVGAARAQVLARLACSGRAPTDLPDVKALGVNGAIEVVWKPVYCAKTYKVTIKRTDVANVNVLAVEVAMPRVVSKNVANGSPYTVVVQACNGEGLCGPKATLTNIVPSGSVKPTLATFDGTASAVAASGAGAVPTQAAGQGWQVVSHSTHGKGFRIPTKKPVARRV